MAAKTKKEAASDGAIRPTKLPQVNKFLREHGIEDVRLERGHGYFTFWGVPIDDWLNRVVLLDRLDALANVERAGGKTVDLAPSEHPLWSRPDFVKYVAVGLGISLLINFILIVMMATRPH